ncbi:MAG: helix-turn-helix domain-containing protein [Tessaracoccus sp.]|uniref:helix-turn-helix domain-containing protein n=1 Tax=Tessaracoccus sp. TaxID=1971211 RepID=UPI001ED270ED|nr:helix-turn-helix domain-containing protein [Tessaracoccus sp.]MBK7823037.1 helix-turn-helix domain-containing protein [Tessaracoccus sp.]
MTAIDGTTDYADVPRRRPLKRPPTRTSASPVSLAELPMLTMNRAVTFTGLSRSTLERAVAGGQLRPCGRVTRRRIMMFERSELERWLRTDAAPSGESRT